jgi:hypothetical protein
MCHSVTGAVLKRGGQQHASSCNYHDGWSFGWTQQKTQRQKEQKAVTQLLYRLVFGR